MSSETIDVSTSARPLTVLSEEEQLLSETVRQFAEEQVRPQEAERGCVLPPTVSSEARGAPEHGA